MLWLRSHQAALPLRVSAIILFILKHHPTSSFGRASNTYKNTKELFKDTVQEILGIPDLNDPWFQVQIHLAHQVNSLGKLSGPH